MVAVFAVRDILTQREGSSKGSMGKELLLAGRIEFVHSPDVLHYTPGGRTSALNMFMGWWRWRRQKVRARANKLTGRRERPNKMLRHDTLSKQPQGGEVKSFLKSFLHPLKPEAVELKTC